jgi:hypothetical protein
LWISKVINEWANKVFVGLRVGNKREAKLKQRATDARI